MSLLEHFAKKKEAPPDITRMREAVKTFWLIRLAWMVDNGHLDSAIRHFMAGDELTINADIKLISNDVLFMNALAGNEITEEIKAKVLAMWKEEG